VRFEGYLPAERLVDVYRSADLFAFPSVNEGLARVLLESMATGLPVVATDCSGAEDCVTPGVDGTVVPAGDAIALASALLWHYENREATKTMGQAARAKIEGHFTLAHYKERMLHTYRSPFLKKTLSSNLSFARMTFFLHPDDNMKGSEA
jgi:glycosyltransferase involved in cell wall biosynthesis